MGNRIGVQSEPTDLKCFVETLKSSSHKSPKQIDTRSSTTISQHDQLILMWEFSSEKKSLPSNHPIKLTRFDSFQENCSYLILHLFTSDFPSGTYVTQESPVIQSQEYFSPRTATLVPAQTKSSKKTLFVSYRIFLWSGKRIGGFLKAFSFSKSCELDNSLSQSSNLTLQDFFFSPQNTLLPPLFNIEIRLSSNLRLWSLYTSKRTGTSESQQKPNNLNLLFSVSSEKTDIKDSHPPPFGIILPQGNLRQHLNLSLPLNDLQIPQKSNELGIQRCFSARLPYKLVDSSSINEMSSLIVVESPTDSPSGQKNSKAEETDSSDSETESDSDESDSESDDSSDSESESEPESPPPPSSQKLPPMKKPLPSLSINKPMTKPLPQMSKVGALKLPNNSDSSSGLRIPLNNVASSSEPFELKPLPERLKIEGSICSQILDNVFQSGQLIAKNAELLRSHGITHILNAGAVAVPCYYTDDFEYLPLYILDGPSEDISCLFLPVLEWMDNVLNSGTKLFIHCHQGVSRSSSMTICYLMWKKKMTFGSSHEFVKKIRSTANPNAGFISQLMVWEKRLHKERPVEKARLLRVTPHCQQTPTFIVAKEVPIRISALDSRFPFILQTKDTFYIWIGKETTEKLKNEAQKAVKRIQKYETAPNKIVNCFQGEETKDFWDTFRDVSVSTPRTVKAITQFLVSKNIVSDQSCDLDDQFIIPKHNEAYDSDYRIIQMSA